LFHCFLLWATKNECICFLVEVCRLNVYTKVFMSVSLNATLIPKSFSAHVLFWTTFLPMLRVYQNVCNIQGSTWHLTVSFTASSMPLTKWNAFLKVVRPINSYYFRNIYWNVSLCFIARHCSIKKSDISIVSNQLDALLRPHISKSSVKSKTNSKSDYYGTGEEELADVEASCDGLGKLLRSVTSLNLSITSVQPISPSARYTEVGTSVLKWFFFFVLCDELELFLVLL